MFECGGACAVAAALGGADFARTTPARTLVVALLASTTWFLLRTRGRGARARHACELGRAGHTRPLAIATLIALALLRAAHSALPHPYETDSAAANSCFPGVRDLAPTAHRAAAHRPDENRSAAARAVAFSAECSSPARSRTDHDAVLVGRWRSDGYGRRGWIDGGDDAPSVRLLCGFDGLEDGEWIALLPGAATRRYATSSVPAVFGASARWAGTAEPLPDQLLRLAPAELDARVEFESRAGAWSWRRELVARAQRLERELPAGFARALLFGETRDLDPQLRDLFARTGTLHLLAVSGTHLVLLCALLLDPLAWLLQRAAFARFRGVSCSARVHAIALGLARAAVLVAYVPLADGQAPVSRSAIALGVAGLAALCPLGPHASLELRAARRRADAWTLWGLALALECAFDAHAPLRLSVQLSYAATLGLMVGYAAGRALLLRAAEPLSQALRTSAYGHARPWWIASPAIVALRACCGALAASCAAVLATLPSAWAVLGECAPPGVLATPLCLPLFGWLLVALWSAVLLPACVPTASYTWPCARLVELLTWIDTWPGTPLPLPPRPVWIVAVCVVLVFLLARRAARDPHASGLRAQLVATALACFACLALCTSPAATNPTDPTDPTERTDATDATDADEADEARMHALACANDSMRAPAPPSTAAAIRAASPAPGVSPARALDSTRSWIDLEALDVGHGTCVVASVAAQATLVFDAGSRERPGLVDAALEPWLARHERRPLWVALSHADLDHAAAMPWLAGHRAPELWLGELPEAARRALPRSTRHVDVAHGAARFDWGTDVDAELWLLRAAPGDDNESSRSVALRAADEWAILCGDAEAQGLTALLDAPLPAHIRVLLWPHHGSDTAWLAQVLARWRPDEVWISAAGEAPIARELTRRGQAWRATHRDGPLRLRLGGAPN